MTKVRPGVILLYGVGLRFPTLQSHSFFLASNLTFVTIRVDTSREDGYAKPHRDAAASFRRSRRGRRQFRGRERRGPRRALEHDPTSRSSARRIGTRGRARRNSREYKRKHGNACVAMTCSGNVVTLYTQVYKETECRRGVTSTL